MLRILAIVAHPDDETMLTGGALALLARTGAQVYYLCATRGEGGEMGEPPVCSREALGLFREREMRCAVQALGGADLTFLGYRDPLVGEDNTLYPYTADLEALSAQIAAHSQSLRPDAIITHGANGEYGHPAHVITHQAVWRAVSQICPNPPLLYTFCAAFPEHPRPHLQNPDDPAHLVLDVSPVSEQKIKAACCHRSQHALFTRRASRLAGRQLSVPEVIMKLEGLHRAFPPTELPPHDIITETLKPWAQLGGQVNT